MKLIKSKKYNNVYSYDTKKGTFYTFRYVYYDLAGKRHEKQQRGFKTELAAYKAELKVETVAANNDTQQLIDSTITMEQWANRFFTMREKRWRPTTKVNYKNCINRYIIPLIGNQRLDRLNKARYDYLFIQPLLDKLSPYSVRDYNRFVMTLMNAAVENDLIPRNKLTGIKIAQSPKRLAFSKSDLAKFNTALKTMKPEYQAFFAILELTGMRRGECLGLTWEDIDLDKHLIRINKTRNYFGVGPTKTMAGRRTVSIPESLTKRLRQLRLIERAKCLRLSQPFSNEQFIITNQFHGPLSESSTFYNFKKILRLAKIDETKYVIHSLRHTHATFLLDSGKNPVDVAKRLGHSDPSVTLQIYSHAVEGRDIQLAEAMAKIVNL